MSRDTPAIRPGFTLYCIKGSVPDGQNLPDNALLFSPLLSILRPALFTPVDAEAVQRPANHMIPHAWQVTHTPAAHEHDAVLLEVVALTADVRGDLFAVGQPDPSDLPQR